MRLRGARETRGGAAVEATVPLSWAVEIAHSRRPASRELKRSQGPLQITLSTIAILPPTALGQRLPQIPPVLDTRNPAFP